MTTAYGTYDSPVGRLLLSASERGLTGLYMDDHRPAPASVSAGAVEREDGPAHQAASAVIAEARRQLELYFAGSLTEFDLPLAVSEGSEFQRRVWEELRTIPYGTTMSYGELARRIGNPGASRAVGLANGRNPISIIVPCHRVIGADGRLTGYGGGLPRKQFLLALEARVAHINMFATAPA